MSWRLRVLILAGVSLAVRLAVFVLFIAGHESRTVTSDSAQYLTLAHHLGAAYVRADSTYKALSVRRTPAYPAFASAVFRLSDGVGLLIVIQIFLGVGTVCLAAQLGKEIAGPRVGFIAGLVVALDPQSILYANQVLTETLFTLLLLVVVFALWRSLAGDWRWAVLAGVGLAVATLTRPIALYLLPIVCFVALAAKRHRGLVIAVVAASFAIPAGAWTVRNKVVADYTGVSSIQEENLLGYRAAGAVSHDTGDSLKVVQDRLQLEAERRAGPSPSVGALAAAQRHVAITSIRHHLIGTVYVSAHGAAAVLFGPGSDSVQHALGIGPHRLVSLCLFLLLVLLLAGSCAGLVILVRERRWVDLAILALLPLYLVAISAGPEAYSRFRVPVVPYLAILFGIATAGVRRPHGSESTEPTTTVDVRGVEGDRSEAVPRMHTVCGPLLDNLARQSP